MAQSDIFYFKRTEDVENSRKRFKDLLMVSVWKSITETHESWYDLKLLPIWVIFIKFVSASFQCFWYRS